MGLESATYISDLVSTNPAAGDAKSQGDDHIRLLKSTVKATFPNVSGAVTATHTELNIMDGVTASTAELNILDGVTASTAELNIMDGVTATTAELNYTDGVTSNIQTQLDAKADTTGETYTGAHNFTGGTVTVAAPTVGANPATKTYADNLAFSAALPSQTGNSGKFVTTDGSTASWAAVAIRTINATVTTSTTISAGYLFVPVAMTAIGQSVTLPDATTLLVASPLIVISNKDGAYNAGIRDNTGTLLGVVAPGGEAVLSLKSISTAAGEWTITGRGIEAGFVTIDTSLSSTYSISNPNPYVALSSTKSIHFVALANGFAAVAIDDATAAVGTPVTVTTTASSVPKNVFAITSTTAVVFYGENANTLRAVVVSLSGATTLSVGAAATLSATNCAVDDFVSAPKIAKLSATSYLVSYANGSTTSVAALEITSGTTATWGTPADIIAANNVADSTQTYTLTATTALVLYKSGAGAPYANNGVVITVSGTTASAGTPAALTGVASSVTGAPMSCLLSATKCLVADNNNTSGSVIASVFTISGTTVTAGTAVSVETGIGANPIYTTDSARNYRPHISALTSSTALLWYLNSSAVSRAVVLSESGGTVTAGTIVLNSISMSSAGTDTSGAILQPGTTSFVSILSAGVSANLRMAFVAHKISGTTISVGENLNSDSFGASATAHGIINGRLSSGAYTAFGTRQHYIHVITTNGAAIEVAGKVSIPMIESGIAPLHAVASNRFVIIANSIESASSSTVRVLSVEVAA